MKNKKLFAVVAFLVCLVALPLMADSCNGDTTNTQQQQQAQNSSANDRLHKANPYPVLTNSQELHNQVEWYKRLSDPHKIAYIYLMNTDGSVAFEYQIMAKCSSTNSQYSTPAEIHNYTSTDGGNVVVPAPQPDGSYGQNEQAVFCFLNDAHQSMIEFSETWHYVWSEVPLNVHETPQTIVVIPNGK